LVSCAFVSCAWSGHAAPNAATNTTLLHPIALPVFRSIDCVLFDVNFRSWRALRGEERRLEMGAPKRGKGWNTPLPLKSHSNRLPIERYLLATSTQGSSPMSGLIVVTRDWADHIKNQ
jgi:hypothetical protein